MWSNLQQTADLVKFTEEIFNQKLHFCAVLPKNVKRKEQFLKL